MNSTKNDSMKAHNQGFENCIRKALFHQRKRHGMAAVDRLRRRFEFLSKLTIIRIALEQLLESSNHYSIVIRYCENLGRLRDLEIIMDTIGNIADTEIFVLTYQQGQEEPCGFIHFTFCNDPTEVLVDWELSLAKNLTRALKLCGYAIGK